MCSGLYADVKRQYRQYQWAAEASKLLFWIWTHSQEGVSNSTAQCHISSHEIQSTWVLREERARIRRRNSAKARCLEHTKMQKALKAFSLFLEWLGHHLNFTGVPMARSHRSTDVKRKPLKASLCDMNNMHLHILRFWTMIQKTLIF